MRNVGINISNDCANLGIEQFYHIGSYFFVLIKAPQKGTWCLVCFQNNIWV